MGRQVRKVPADWKHPYNNEKKRFTPLYEGHMYHAYLESYIKDSKEFKEKGFKKNFPDAPDYHYEQYLKDWIGDPPVKSEHMPDWKESEKTHFMMYENTSEGTPISPAFETPEELAQWLFDNKVSSFADMTSSYESWLQVANGGYAPGLVINNGKMTSGVGE